MPTKVTTVSATPESWSEPLESRTIAYDPIHGEMIDIGFDTPTSLIGEEVGIYADQPAQREYDIVGDDTDEMSALADQESDTETTEEDGEEGAPEDSDEDPNAHQMAPDSNAPGPSAPPAFSPVSGPAATVLPAPVIPRKQVGRYHHTATVLPNVASKAKQVAAVKTAIANFRAKIAQRDPVAIKSLFALQAQAKAGSAPHKAVLNAVVRAKVGGSVHMGGNAGLIGNTLTKILSLALSPVAWAADGVGTVAKGVGTQLEHLAGKL